MVVTEVAILPLANGADAAHSASLLAKFKRAKATLEKAANHNFYFLQQVEDQSFVYILGSWSSVAEHESFLPSPENQELLALLKDEVKVDGIQMWHLDGDLLHSHGSTSSILDAPTISCNRHFVLPEKKEGFTAKFDEVEQILVGYTKPIDVKGGWRIEKEVVDGKEKEEWVLLSGFNSVEHHHGFAATAVFTKYREIVGFVTGFEVRHLKKIEGL